METGWLSGIRHRMGVPGGHLWGYNDGQDMAPDPELLRQLPVK